MKIFILCLLAVAAQDERLAIRFNSEELTFVSLESGEVKFTTFTLNFEDLPLDDQKRIMEFTG